MSLKAFVAGATGYTGKQVVTALRHANITTVAHIRPGSPQREHAIEYFEAQGATVDSTPWAADAITNTLKTHAPNLIFGLLGTTRRRAKDAEKAGLDPELQSYEHVDFGYTAMLIDAGKQLPTPPKFIYLSSLGVHRNSKGAYLQARWRAEQHLQKSRLPFVIARPSFITGPDREESRPLERAAAIAVDSTLSLSRLVGAGRVHRKYGSINAEALAAALVRLALDPQAENKIFASDLLR